MPQKIYIKKFGIKQILFICITAIICIATLGLGFGLGFSTGSRNENPAEALQNENRVLPRGITQVSAGGGHTLAIDSQGNLWAFGYGTYGQLGNMSTTQNNHTPINITAQPGNPLNGKQIVQATTGQDHTMIIDSAGSLWAFGAGGSGRLGDMSTANSSTPINITAQGDNPLYGKQIVQVSAATNGFFTMAIDAQGNLWAFGTGNSGQLGNMSNTATNSTPINITAQPGNSLDGIQIVQVATGQYHTMAIDSIGDLWAFGTGSSGQLGNMSTTGIKSTPINITAQSGNPLYGKQIVQVSAGKDHTMAIDSQGSLWAFGSGNYGHLGNMSTTQTNHTPINITAQSGNPLYGKQIVQVEAGVDHTMAIDAQGNLWAFGRNNISQLGNMSTSDSSTPINITDQTDNSLKGKQIVQVSAGFVHTMAIDAQGNLWAFGSGGSGRLGNMEFSSSSTPINLTAQPGNPLNDSQFGRMQISAALRHTMTIDAQGNLWGFGQGDSGQLGNMASTGTNSTPINITAQSGNPLYGKQIVQVSAGNGHTMAIDSQGNLWAFGGGGSGQLGNMAATGGSSTPINITAQSGNPLYGKQIVQVSAGWQHTMAIDSQGELWAWGANSSGQLGNLTSNFNANHTPINITGQWGNPLYDRQIVQVSASGASHTVAIDSQGNLWAFGINSNGQLGDMSTDSSNIPINLTEQTYNPLNGKQIVQVSAGWYHTMAIDATGNLWAFGQGDSGQLGNMAADPINSTPINITEQIYNSLNSKEIVQVSAGNAHTMAIDAQGNLWAFGSGANGRLGNMGTSNNSDPINITAQIGNPLNGKQIVQVSAAASHTMAIDAKGETWAFGNGENGKLGNKATATTNSTPINISAINTSATILGNPQARISVRTNFTTGWGETTATGGTYTDWTANILNSPTITKNNNTQEGRVRYEFDASGINKISSMTINTVSVNLTGYSTLTFWNNTLYLRIIMTDSSRRMIVEMDRINTSPVAISVTTTNSARVTATVSGSPNARISVRTSFTTGWGETSATGGAYTDWTANSLTAPDVSRSNNTEIGRVRYEFDANGINTVSAITINGTSINLTGYNTLTLWNSLLYLRVISADSNRRLIVEMDRINTDQPVEIAATTTNNAKATASIASSTNARISVRTDFTTGWGTTTASGGTFTNWTADTLTSPDVNRNDSTQTGRIRYEFDANSIDTITTLTINGTAITLTSYSNLTLWNSIFYLRVISADSNRRLIVEMDRINTDQLVTLSVTTTRNVQHNFNFTNTSHISSRMKMNTEAETTSLSNTFTPSWSGNTGTITSATFTFTSQATFSKITISRPSLSNIVITNFSGGLETVAPGSGLTGLISSSSSNGTNTMTILLIQMEQYEYTWTIETYQAIQVQQILNPPAGAASIADPALLTLNSSSGANWADLALASPANQFGKTFAGWYTHPDYLKGTLITATTELQQHITATGGAIVFLYARWA